MFRFEAMWTKEKGCKDVVERAWRLGNATDGMLGIGEKIQCCGELLSAWNKQHFGNVYTQLKKAKHELKRPTEMAPNRLSQEALKQAKLEASQRRSKNFIRGVRGSDGNWKAEAERDAEILAYFQNLFTASSERSNVHFLDNLGGEWQLK
ncbi:unnamed protein product [Fraxinus pennsylvanica]|uniref:Uncharacterized protein n=1 Tax=Fraxinus pennsylvanica TaxID=56036 RepID=A0AAD2DVE4_9LAMI|nr:unnamed protein product [Fraxinus pennsylvanica]